MRMFNFSFSKSIQGFIDFASDFRNISDVFSLLEEIYSIFEAIAENMRESIMVEENEEAERLLNDFLKAVEEKVKSDLEEFKKYVEELERIESNLH